MWNVTSGIQQNVNKVCYVFFSLIQILVVLSRWITSVGKHATTTKVEYTGKLVRNDHLTSCG